MKVYALPLEITIFSAPLINVYDELLGCLELYFTQFLLATELIGEIKDHKIISSLNNFPQK